jgi:hypothetical protein
MDSFISALVLVDLDAGYPEGYHFMGRQWERERITVDIDNIVYPESALYLLGITLGKSDKIFVSKHDFEHN